VGEITLGTKADEDVGSPSRILGTGLQAAIEAARVIKSAQRNKRRCTGVTTRAGSLNASMSDGPRALCEVNPCRITWTAYASLRVPSKCTRASRRASRPAMEPWTNTGTYGQASSQGSDGGSLGGAEARGEALIQGRPRCSSTPGTAPPRVPSSLTTDRAPGPSGCRRSPPPGGRFHGG